MDTRRFSARADVGAGAAPVRRDIVDQPVLDRVFVLTRINWEAVIFVSIMLLAIVSRLWDLGSRSFHHDESIHAYYSNYYLKNGVYTTTQCCGGGYDPVYHGPFLYHVTALMFLLFGTNDATARLGPALFGVALIGLCWLLRPFIGRIGAVLAAFLVLISPSITYYSRSLRHDIFALFGLTLLFISILWFMRTHRSKWVYLGAIGLIIAYSSHELTYIVVLLFVLFLVAALFLFPAFSERFVAGNRKLVGDEGVNPVKSAWQALMARRWTLIGAIATFLGIYTVLYTNMLTKPLLFPFGFVNGIAYWLSQQGVNRGTQPVWYYLMLMPIYEPLALIAGLGTIVWLIVRWSRGQAEVPQSDDVDIENEQGLQDQYGVPYPSMQGMRGFTLAFLAFWSIAAFVAFSLAGERLPWLNMQIALPFTLIASAGIGSMLARIQWREVRKGGGLFLGVTVVLFIFALFMTVANFNGSMPAPTGETAGLQTALRTVLLLLFTLGFLAISGWLAYKMVPSRAVAVVGLTFAVLLTLYGIRAMSLATYRHGDVPTEMLVYTQSSPDVPIVMDLIQRLSRDETAFDSRNADDVTGGHSLAIFLDQNDAIEWPIDWYLRDMRGLHYFNLFTTGSNGALQEKSDADKANLIAPNAPVILVSEATENSTYFQNFIKDKYTTNKYPLNWWFPEETYKDNVTQPDGSIKQVGNFGKMLGWLTGNGMKYLLYRDPGMGLGSRNFYLHVRNDIAYKTGLAAPPSTGGTTNDGKTYGLFDLAQGAGNGQFSLPRGLAIDAQGNFYVADTGNYRIEKFDPSGKFLLAFGSKGTDQGQFNAISESAGPGTGPGGVAVDKAGNVYVADTWNHRIQKFNSKGEFVTTWGSFISLADPNAASDPQKDSKFYGPRGVAVGPDGNVYVTDTGNKRVSIFDPTGKFLRQISSNISPEKVTSGYAFNAPGEMNEPIGIAVDSAGNVYVADTNNHRVQKFDPAGKPAAQWPIPAGNWDPGSYLEPFLAVDAQGNVYASAPTGGGVLKFTSTGQVAANKKSTGAITLKTPTGIAVGADGTVYVSDTNGNGVVNMGKMP